MSTAGLYSERCSFNIHYHVECQAVPSLFTSAAVSFKLVDLFFPWQFLLLRTSFYPCASHITWRARCAGQVHLAFFWQSEDCATFTKIALSLSLLQTSPYLSCFHKVLCLKMAGTRRVLRN